MSTKQSIAQLCRSIQKENAIIGLPPSHPDIVRSLAWQRWARRKSGRQLGDFILGFIVRNCLRHSEACAMFEEIYHRVKKSPPRPHRVNRKS
jgi:hypothetical protein